MHEFQSVQSHQEPENHIAQIDIIIFFDSYEKDFKQIILIPDLTDYCFLGQKYYRSKKSLNELQSIFSEHYRVLMQGLGKFGSISQVPLHKGIYIRFALMNPLTFNLNLQSLSLTLVCGKILFFHDFLHINYLIGNFSPNILKKYYNIVL